MIVEKIDLYKYFGIKRKKGAEGYLLTYVHEQFEEFCVDRLRPAMLCIPGGGYEFRSDRETEPIAIAYLNAGFNAFTLKYSIKPFMHPTQLIEGCMAIAYLRENANKYHISKDQIGAIGFSAGGHLAGMLATMFDSPVVVDVLKEKAKLCRANAVVLSYAVISSKEYAHLGSFVNLSGGNEGKKVELSLEDRVNKNSVPAFIWGTVNDNVVPSENSLLMANAYKKAGVPFALHLFEDGLHGLSLSSRETSYKLYEKELVKPDVAKWFDMSVDWLKFHGFEILI